MAITLSSRTQIVNYYRNIQKIGHQRQASTERIPLQRKRNIKHDEGVQIRLLKQLCSMGINRSMKQGDTSKRVAIYVNKQTVGLRSMQKKRKETIKKECKKIQGLTPYRSADSKVIWKKMGAFHPLPILVIIFPILFVCGSFDIVIMQEEEKR